MRPHLTALLSLLLLGGCGAVRVTNVEPAKELAKAQAPAPAAAYLGWRVYQQRCASCHGVRAEGLAGGGPDLLLAMRDIGPKRFADIVLRRYADDLLQLGPGSPRETLLDDLVERREPGRVSMPAWQGDPVVEAHVMDLYVYLVGRSEGRIGAQPLKRP